MAHNRPNLIQAHHIQGNVPSMARGMASLSYSIMPQPGMIGQRNIYPSNGQNMSFIPPPHPIYCMNQTQLTDEQLRLQQREHNYHLQQQRLSAFNASTAHNKKISPDTFIESMFGKPVAPKPRPPNPTVPKNIPAPVVTVPSPMQMSQPSMQNAVPISQTQAAVKTSANIQVPHVSMSQSSTSLNKKKKLEDMLLECSDLMRPGKAHTFPKTSSVRKDNKNLPDSSKAPAAPITIVESDEKVDDNSVVEQKTNNLGFPSWCFIDAQIPDLYRQVQQMATHENSLDTNRLYQILVSSGLHRDVLGHIWSLVNQTTPGQLLPHELYAALTLIALAQNGYKFSGLDILQPLARPLVPFLKQVMVTNPLVQTERRDSHSSSGSNSQQDEFTDFLGFTPSVQKPAAVGSSAVGNRLANYSVGLTQPSAIHTEKTEMEDFANFQNAITVPPSNDSDTKQQPSNVHSNSSQEDKYSIFRELDRERHTSGSTDKTEDEFGDFLCVEEPIAQQVPGEQKNNHSLCPYQNVAAQFNLKLFGEKSVDSLIQSSLSEFQLDRHPVITKSVPENDDNQFGDFVSPGEATGGDISLLALGQHLKDPGSAESQSVSSLELGPLDTGVAAGSDNFGSLSRQDSLHSLDFKATFPDDDYCEQQSSSAFNVDSSNQINHLLDDPYRFVRSEIVQSDIERNECEWERCLESCYQLIRGANSILSDITSAAVCSEVINSDEGANYLKNIVEIYRVAIRLQLSIKASGISKETVNNLLRNIETAWTNISAFILDSPIMPLQESLDFTDQTLKPDSENNAHACGVCLLDVTASDSQSRVNGLHCLEFSGRQYHATCANFWVNCVNSLLPALTLQQQLL